MLARSAPLTPAVSSPGTPFEEIMPPKDLLLGLPRGWQALAVEAWKELAALGPQVPLAVTSLEKIFGRLSLHLEFPPKTPLKQVTAAYSLAARLRSESLHTCEFCGGGDASSLKYSTGKTKVLCRTCGMLNGYKPL